MKMEYESPVMEIFSFNTSDTIMDDDCTTYSAPDLGCPYDFGCIMDGVFPNFSNL